MSFNDPDHVATALSLGQKIALLSGCDVWFTKTADRAGIPSLMLSDGPNGLRVPGCERGPRGIQQSKPSTCFPPAVAQASSWDPELVADWRSTGPGSPKPGDRRPLR